MIQKFKKPISVLLALMMVVSLFAIVPITASAAVGDFVPESDYLTFTAEEAGSSVTLKVPTGNSFQYDLNGTGLTDYTLGTEITLANVGDFVRFRGRNTAFSASNHVSITGKVACSGNVMSLRLDEDGRDQGLSYGCFNYMFEGCTGLTAAPELPETTLASHCYECMFFGCTNLTAAPELPATALATGCYSSMFAGCTSLTTAPELWATTLATGCYDHMFYACTSLTTAPELPATTLARNCYSYMFAGCSSIKLSETQTAEYSIPYSVPSGGDGTAASSSVLTSALRNMFAGTGGTFTGTPEINKTYYLYREIPKYTVTWKNGDTELETDENVAEGTTPTYDGEAPTKASDKYYDYTFSGWTPAVAPVTEDVTYTAQFTATAKTFKVYVKKLTGGTPYTIENLTGGTTVAQLKEIIADQIDIPVTAQQRLVFAGKTIEDAKTLAEYNIGEESTIHLIIRSYTVTWLNYDNSELDTTTVQYGATPSYDGETPTKPEDENNTYTFSGWTPEITAVTGDATYTAQFTAVPKPAPTPTPAKLTLHVGENGKVVMDNGTFGNATDASNITEIHGPVNVADGYNASIANVFINDGHSVNLVEGGSINIAAGGEVSFYPSADNTGKITAIPNEGYICTGWYNGDTRYTKKDTIDYQNISEGMTLTAKFAPKLFPQHSVTLGGDIGVNFYINPAAANFANASEATVKFTWDGGKENSKEVSLKGLTTNEDGYYKATVDVVAAHVAHKIHAEVYLNGEKLDQTDDYSVQDYAEEVYKNPAKYDSEKPEQLKALAKALLNYGAMAQIVFDGYLVEKPALANTVVGDNGYEGVTADQIEAAIKGSASNLNTAAAAFDAEFYTSSLIYLSRNTLRLYFTPASKTVGALDGKGFSGNLSGYYYYVDHANIPAAKLDDQQSFTIGDKTFTFSALDYAAAVVNSDNMKPEQQNLAKALYLYNKAANEYFEDAPAPAEKILVLDNVTEDTTVEDGYTITGTLKGDYKISIADDATVTLKGVNITCLSNNNETANFAGITPLGDATIMLEGANTVKGGYEDFPGVFVPVGKTLTIDGTGSLNASSNGYGCGIGGGNVKHAGNIIINGGTIIATGGEGAAGIGVGGGAQCGDITITGGTVTANGGLDSPGIGSGGFATCGNITIANTVTSVTATKGGSAPNSIGAGRKGTCGTVTIAPGANVTQN